MPRPKKSVPTYSLHKPSGQAVVKESRPDGRRHTHYLGVYNSPESKAAYAALLARVQVTGLAPAAAATSTPTTLSLNELILAFMRHAEGYYRRPNGTQTKEVANHKMAFRPLKALFGDLPACRFGPRELKQVRDWMVRADWCRTQVNKHVGRIRGAVKWAVSEGLVPVEVHLALTTVAGLQCGRSVARESKPVLPVPAATMAATLPHVLPAVRCMIEVQLLTGMRPGEVCEMRPVDIDTAGGVWVYRPPHHKLAYRGKKREIAIGPKAQSLLSAFTPSDPGDHYFSPRRAVEQMRAERAAARKTPRWPSSVATNASKRVAAPQRQPADHYRVTSYWHAIAKGCDRAFPPPAPLGRRHGESKGRWLSRLTVAQRAELVAWQKSHRWHPNQLRHAFATDVRRGHGLEAAQVLLGHSKADVTQVYAERNSELARSVAAQIG